MVKRDFVDGATVLTRQKLKRISNTGHVGIHYMVNYNTHQIQVRSRIIGCRIKLDDAIALRDEARRRVADGTFEDWYAAMRKSKKAGE